MPEMTETRSGYHAHAARVNDATVEGMEAMRPYFRAHLVPRLPAARDAKILDVGCGYGKIVFALRHEGFTAVTGFDASPEQVEAARALGIGGIECAEAKDWLEARSGSYDAIVLFDVIEHIPKAEVVPLLAQCRSALKPGGRLVLQTPNGLSPLDPYRYADFTHETSFTVASINQVLEEAGFERVTVYPVAPHIHGPASLVRSLLWRFFFVPLVRFYLLVAIGDAQGGVYTPNLIAVGETGVQRPTPA